MFVYLVHHAEAVPPGVDARRPLSARGLAQAEWLARHAREKGVQAQAIWHSGKLRGRQTAESFLRLCGPMAAFQAVRGLQPGDPPQWIHDALLLEARDILVVGHIPNLPALAGLFGASDSLPLNGMLAFERTGAATFEMRWSAAPPQENT